MYYKCNDLILIPYEYSKIEIAFFTEIKEIINTFPLKIYDFFEKIHNTEITYIRDSTMIVSLFKLNKNEMKNIFEILKRFLRIKAISKIFYKKEFIIIHFYNDIISTILTKEKAWMYIDYYFIIKEKITQHVYYQAIIKKDKIEKNIEMFFYHNKKYYVFTNDLNIIDDTNNIIICSIECKKNQNDNIKTLKYFLSNKLKEEEIYKLVFTE